MRENNLKVGDIFHDSWGYNMTLNVFIKVIKISPTGKTAICKLVNSKWISGDKGYTGRVIPTNEENKDEPEFRLRICGEENITLRGTYPLNKKPFRLATFLKVKEGEDFYENHMD